MTRKLERTVYDLHVKAVQQVLADRQATEGQEQEPSHNNRGTMCEMGRSL